MALPNPPAAAYDGYTYTERICQEYGQQPRWYRVRDPIPGSDWRNDGGWAIVLERGSNVTPPVYAVGNAQNQVGYPSRAAAFTAASGQFTSNNGIGGLAPRTYITAQNGVKGWVAGFAGDLVVDRNQDGELTDADMGNAGGANPWFWERRTYSVVNPGANYGTQYIRWAYLAWCR